MAEYHINVDNTVNQALELGEFSGKVGKCYDELHDISVNPSMILSAGMVILAGNVDAYKKLFFIANDLKAEIKKIGMLGGNLTQIVNRYKQAEKIACDLQGKVNYNRADGEDLLAVPNDEKDAYISEFEKEHGDLAAQLDTFLKSGRNNKLTEDDIRNIKYMAYTAEEPFRSIFLNAVKNYSIGDGDMNGGAYFTNDGNTVNYTYHDVWDDIFAWFRPENDAFGRDPRGQYTTFFHENGHAIDYTSNMHNADGYDTATYTTYSENMGREVTLIEAINYDVFDNPDNPHSITSIANQIKSEGVRGTGCDGDVSNVIDALKSGNTDALSDADLDLYNEVVGRYKHSAGSGAKFEAPSDVYGGVTHNVLRIDYGHDDATYWVAWGKEGDYAPALELWAEYFSYNMSGSTENLKNVLEYFPEASKVMEQYALSFES